MKSDRYMPARLLSGRSSMSAPEKEAVLAGVLERGAGGEAVPRAAGGRLAWAAGAVAILLVVPLLIVALAGGESSQEQEFATRGAGGAPFGFEAGCAGSGGCRAGDKLLFRVRPPEGKPYFSAFGVRPDGVVVWYFPAREEETSRDVRGAAGGVLGSGIRLDADHPPGTLVIHGQFCSQATSRERIRTVYQEKEPPEAPASCVLLERIIQVGP